MKPRFVRSHFFPMRKFTAQKSGDKYPSFLDAIEAESFTISDIDHQALLEFLTFGSFYFEDTLVEGIKKQFTHQGYNLDIDDGLVEELHESEHPLKRKTIDDPVCEFLDFFEQRAHHLQDKKISVDLTGGIDSRLVATVLRHFGVAFDAAFSLHSGDAQEAEIVQEVANCLGVNVHILHSEESNGSKEDFEGLFKLSDGLWDFTGLGSLRYNQTWRREKGYDLVITGVGGELYKDFWWQQDFPFYNNKSTDLDKLISMRMYPAKINENWLGDWLQESYKNYQASFKEKLQLYVQETNTQSYDHIYYHVRIKEQVSVLSNITSQFLGTYSPLLESELLTIGYNLPRRKRFFNQFHRDVITRIHPEVAKIRTTEGNISVSDNLFDKVSDINKYGLHKAKSLFLKLRGQQRDVNFKNSSKEFILQRHYEESLYLLRDFGLVSNKIPNDHHKVQKNIVGRLITLSEVIKKMK